MYKIVRKCTKLLEIIFKISFFIYANIAILGHCPILFFQNLRCFKNIFVLYYTVLYNIIYTHIIPLTLRLQWVLYALENFEVELYHVLQI